MSDMPADSPSGMQAPPPQNGMANPLMEGMEEGIPYEEGPPPPMFNLQPPMGMPVSTPATMPQAFQSQTELPKPPATFIGSGAKGPDLLLRVLMGLQSGVRSEADWCLTTLLNFTTAHNPDLLRTRMDILNLVIDFINDHWDEVTRSKLPIDDDYSTLLLRSKVLEALLIMRNVCIDQMTAVALAPNCLSFIEAGVKLPNLPQYHEMRLLSLEVCEHVCFLPAANQIKQNANDSTSSSSNSGAGPGAGADSTVHGLFEALVNILASSQDKSVLMSALRSVSRLLVFDTRETSPLLYYPKSVIRVFRFTMIDDAELQACALELLQQFFSRLQRVDQISSVFGGSIETDALSRHLVRLLCFQMEKEPADYLRLPRRTRKLAPVVPPTIPPSLMQSLLRLPEPERATAWIRASYDLDPEGEVLQVSLWTAYQRLFEPHERDGTGHRMLKAIDFIRTCTTNVRGAQAKVVSTPEGPKKFIIKGLVPRETALSLDPTPADNDVRANRAPPVFGDVAANCLVNIAKLQGGKQLLEPLISELVESAILNSKVFEKIDLVLGEISA